MIVYRLVRTDLLPPGLNAAMRESNPPVIYVRASLAPVSQCEAIHQVMQAARLPVAA